jgi:hypothetical protein
MWLIVFLLLQAASTLDFDTFKTSVQPLLLEKRPGHARCYVCHSRSTAFRLQPLSPGAATWNDEQSQKNFEMAKRFVLPGVPAKSRLLTMPLAEEAGGVAFHPGGKHWMTQDDPEWKVLADWVKGKK